MGSPVPPVPDLSNITSPYATRAATAPTQPENIGYANKSMQVGSGIAGVLQGLQQGFAKKQMDKFNQAKSDYSISKAQYDAAAARVAQLKSQGSDPNSEEFKNAQTHLDQATAELGQSSQALVDLAHGGGGKGKNADPKIGGIIGKALDVLMGKVPATSHPAAAPSATPTSTPPFVPASPNPFANPANSAGNTTA